MATTSRPSRPSVDFDIHINDSSDHGRSPSPGNRVDTLKDLPLSSIQNIKPSGFDTLTRHLNNLRIHSSASKENGFVQPQGRRESGPRVRVSVETTPGRQPHCDNRRVASGSFNSIFSGKSTNFRGTNDLALASHHLPDNRVQLAKHQEGQFDWLLSLPIRIVKSAAKGRRSLGKSRDDQDQSTQGEKQFLFGCNLVHHRAPPGNGNDKPVNTYTLLATRIQQEEEPPMPEESENTEDGQSVVANADTSQLSLNALDDISEEVITSTEGKDMQKQPETMTAMNIEDNFSVEHHNERHLSVSPQPPHTRPLSRIEDSVEELDNLHEQIEEALEEVAQLNRAISPDGDEELTEIFVEVAAPVPVIQPAPAKRLSSVRAAPVTSTLRTRTSTATPAERTSSARRSTISSSRADSDSKSSAKPTPTATRKTVTRPTSLLPPKGTTRSSKTPTVPAFELPGEAVARRLKEQRAARLSQSHDSQHSLTLSSSKAPTSPSKTAPTARSTRPLTKPAFELPGEAISRRKREEREAKLKQMEEEEKKRREFRARPVPSSVKASGAGGLTRETAASQARRAEISPLRAKRDSMIGSGTEGTPRMSRVTMTVTSTSRGRVSVAAGSESRGTSSSSGNALKSQVGSVKGKEVFKRESEYTSIRQKERREREEAAKAAREKAAERSKLAAKEWKEKQMMRERKRMSMFSGRVA
ncbi:hypothetical protein QBC38DRAFT_152998 [Podospora fimiseda]|uniref:Carboxylesterase family protein n=1 Tax=Podospora fimiseda TaxID=252190 RepID=A0AAN7H3U9_9PEZI|nr:hypothetical protein QBC38DRAFT_152998 [Podospora fimiseda]